MPVKALGTIGTRSTSTRIGTRLNNAGGRYNAGIPGWHVPAQIQGPLLTLYILPTESRSRAP